MQAAFFDASWRGDAQGDAWASEIEGVLCGRPDAQGDGGARLQTTRRSEECCQAHFDVAGLQRAQALGEKHSGIKRPGRSRLGRGAKLARLAGPSLGLRGWLAEGLGLRLWRPGLRASRWLLCPELLGPGLLLLRLWLW